MTEPTANILLIEPDKRFAIALTQFLTKEGHHVDSVSTALEAERRVAAIESRQSAQAVAKTSVLSFADQLGPDVVIVELDVHDESGIGILKRIKRVSPYTTVLLISSDGSARDVVDALRKGVDDFLIKPLDDFTVVQQVMLRALKRSKLEAEHAQAQLDLQRLNTELRESMHAIERDQAAGRMVQERLLPPKSARFDGVDVNFEIIPSFYLSGDSIDYGFMAGRYLAFYLSDVSGHGAASAFVTVWVKQLVRSFFRDKDVFRDQSSFNGDIPKLMRLLNEELINADIGHHLTCFVGVIDTHTLEMNYVVGGHLPLPVLIQRGCCVRLEGKGKPLGIFDGAEWQVSHVNLEPTFQLMVCSDGVLELFDGENLSAKEGALLRFLENQPSVELKSLSKRLPLQNRDTLPDDVAMLLIARQ